MESPLRILPKSLRKIAVILVLTYSIPAANAARGIPSEAIEQTRAAKHTETSDQPKQDKQADGPRQERGSTGAATTDSIGSDSSTRGSRFIHRIGAEFRPEYICPTNDFLRGANLASKRFDVSLSAHLRYSLGFRSGSLPDRIYKGSYLGIGVAYYNLGNKQELGNPVAVYLFQGARIARISPRLSFDYEWNFGLSLGWVPYNRERNEMNKMMGSKINAYINADFFLNWMLTRRLDLTAGIALTHFSNGNTKIPNTGLNSIGMKLGLVYNFGRENTEIPRRSFGPAFPRHVSYDLMLFGSWRSKGVKIGDQMIATPDAYPVAGLNFAAMYNFSYRFRAGLSLDGVYDGSANVYAEDRICSADGHCPDPVFRRPSIDKQIALGISARGEFVMPYFSIGFGIGFNVLHKGGDLESFYQMLTLKIAVTRSSFLHIGYSIKDFHIPNFLMLGVGYRFNNKYPRVR